MTYFVQKQGGCTYMEIGAQFFTVRSMTQTLDGLA